MKVKVKTDVPTEFAALIPRLFQSTGERETCRPKLLCSDAQN
jgi:hypothetical protein